MDKDLISRSALLEQVRFSLPIDSERRRVISDCVDITRRLITEAPSVDAVEVVRCKDCEWWNRPGCAIYIVDDTDKPKAEDYCSFGVRRRSDD